MKLFLKIVLGLAVLIGLAVVAVMYFTSGAREAGKAFVINMSSGAYDEARAVMHPALAEQFKGDELREMMGAAEAFTEVSFSSIAASGGNTELSGSATTASGCSSKVDLELLKGQVISFNITPLCPKP